MTTSTNTTDTSNLPTLILQFEQLLEQFPPARHIRRLASAVRQLAHAESQPLNLVIAGAELQDCENLKQKIVEACPAIAIRCSPCEEIVQSPRLLQEINQWSEAALIMPASTPVDQAVAAHEKIVLRCLRNPILLATHDEAGRQDGNTALRLSLESITAEPRHLWDTMAMSLKRLAVAQRLSQYASSLNQLHLHSLQHYKLVLSQMERPARSTSLRAANIDSDKAWVPMRDALADRTAIIEREMVLASERATQPLGELSGMLRSIVNGVSEGDLESTRTSSQLKMSVNAGHLSTLNRRFEHTLHERFTRDLKQAEHLVRIAMDDAYRQNSADQALNDSKLPAIDFQKAWRSVENLMAIGKEAAIELPRKGVFDLLTAGRQKVFIIIMFVSLMGRMGLPKLFTSPVAQLGFGLFMAMVMIVSMVSAIGRWRKENAQTIEKEIQKFRENLVAEGSKVIDQVERVKLNTIREYFKDANRSFESICKLQIESLFRQQQARADELQQRQDAARKVYESRLKQVADIERPLQRFVEAVEATVVDCRRNVMVSMNCGPVAAAQAPVAQTKTTRPEPTRALSALAQRRARSLISQSSSHHGQALENAS